MELNKIFNQSRYDTYVEHLKSLGLSDSSINRKLSSISSFHKYLVKKKKIDPTIPIKTRLVIPTNKPIPPLITPKQPWLKYFLFSSIVILILGLGYTFFIQIFNRASKNLAFTTASAPITPNRILSFQGRLTDSSGNPITSSTGALFKLYNSGTGGTELYTSGAGNSQTVTPDENGIFSVVIGKSHGLGIPSSVFSENADVWLEITAGGETMNPRQQIATVGYALNAETLQGLPPSASGFKNTVLVIDGFGNLNLGETSPTIYSQSGTLGIIGQALLIGTSDGSGGNITINPDGAGKLKLITEGTGSTATGGLIEATNANLSTGNLYSAYINNDNRGYNFIDFSNYNVGTTTLSSRFSVSASGSVNVSNNLNVGSSVTFSGISLGSGSTALFIDSSGTLSKRSLGLLAFQDIAVGTTYSFSNGLTNSSGNVGLGGTLSSNTLINTNSNFLSFLGLGNSQSLFVGSSGFVGIGTTNPAVELNVIGSIQASSNIVVGSGSFLKFGNSANTIRGGLNYLLFKTNSVDQLMIDASGFVGIGTTLPTKKLDIAGDINLTGTIFSNGNSGSSGQVLSSTGTGLAWISGTGTTYSAGTGLTLSATNIFSLNLGSTNIWLAPQFFGNGIGVTGNLTVGGTFVSVGSTNLVTNLNANYLNGLPSSSFLQTGYTGFDNYRNWAVNVGTSNLTIGSTSTLSFATGAGLSATLVGNTITFTNTSVGTTYSFKNGLTNNTGIVGLGGTLTQNTTIGTSSFGLSFLGLGNSQSLFIGASGFVGIGTTSPRAKLEVVGVNSTSSVGSELVTNGDFSVGTGWTGTPTDWVISGGTASHTVGNSTWLSQPFNTIAGMYEITFTTTFTSGTLSVNIGNGPTQEINASNTYSLYLRAEDSTLGIQFMPTDNSWDGTIDDVSVKPISESEANLILQNDQGINTTGNKVEFRTSQNNIFIGENSGNFYTGYGDNISLGGNALSDLIGGFGNIAIGQNYDYSGTSGVLGKLRDGYRNISLGVYSGRNLMHGYQNTFLGADAGSSLIDGANNVFIGNNAASDLQYAEGKLYIAHTSGTPLIYGDFYTGQIGLGTTAPTKTLDIVGDINLTGTIFTAGTSGSPGQILSSTGTGLQWIAAGAGTTYAFTNGLTNTSNTVRLGGTLTQNTSIGTSSFGLSFLGLGNSQSLFISSSGNVSIGTTSNSSKLNISSDHEGINNTIFYETGTTSSIYGFYNQVDLEAGTTSVYGIYSVINGDLGSATNSYAIYAQSLLGNRNHGIYVADLGNTGTDAYGIFQSGSNDYNYFGGNVGLGTTAPSKKLDVVGDIKLTGSLFVGAGVTGSNGQVLASNGAGSLQWISGAGTTYAFTNGLTNSTNTISLGGTLTQNTTIGTSSFSLNIGQGATQSLFISSGGNLGIGNTNPGAKLQINNTSSGSFSILTKDTSGVDVFSVFEGGVGGALLRIGSSSAPNVYLSSHSVSQWINNGNFGLGTTAPSKKLDVVGDIELSGTLFVGAGVTGSSGQVLASNGAGSLQWTTVSSGTTYSFTNGLTNSTNTISLGGTLTQNTTIGTSSFGLSFLGLGNSQALFIGASGYVGIGTTNPGYKFDIASDISTTFPKSGYLTVDNTLISSLDGGNYFGRVGVKESQLGIYNVGNTWTQTASSHFWNSVAVSSDGKFQTATDSNPGYIWISSDYGSNWSQVGATDTWNGVAMSSDGKVQTAVVNGGYIYTSNNYGASWSQTASNRNWKNVAMSSDGRIQTAVVYAGNIWVSTDYGINWSQKGSVAAWYGLEVSSDGKIQVAATETGFIWRSIDYGNSWTQQLSGSYIFDSLAMSSDGKYITAADANNGFIWVSSDYGANWSQKGSALSWSSVTMTSNGQIQTAVVFGGYIWVSTDYGANWSQKGFVGNWIDVATSSDGKIQTALNRSGNIWLSFADSYFLGNLGLGTTSPSKKLDVAGDIKLTGTLFVGAGVTGTNNQVLASNGAGGLQWITPSGTGTTYSFTNGLTNSANIISLGGTLTQNTTIGTSSFGLSFLGLGNSQALFIGASGYVGIGTTNPSKKLDIAGDIKLTGTLFVGAGVTGTSGQVLASNGAGGLQWTSVAGVSDMSVVQKHRSTGYTLTTGFTGITLDVTDIENDTATIEHDASDDGRINVKETGLYEIHYHGDVVKSTVSTWEFQVMQNGTTVVPGSPQAGLNSSTDKTQPSVTTYASLNANDFLIVQGRGTTAGGIFNNFVFSVKRLKAPKGDVGPSGPAGTTYSAGTGLTLSATNIFSLNLGSTNIWLAPQFFGNGIGVTGNLTVGGTFVSVGSTNLVTNLNANYLNGLPSSSFLQTGYTGFINTATNGLQKIGSTAVGLGGTLTQNTSIGLSSFSLSMFGLGGTQALYIGNSGKIAIGSTAQNATLSVSNNAPALSGYDLLALGDHLGNTYFSVNGFGGLINATPSITIGNTLSAINFGDSNLSISGAGTVFKINSGSVGSSGYSFRVQENSVDYLVINGDGNVGLGTTAPSKKLDVIGDIELSGTFFVGAGVTGSSGQVLASNGAGGLQWITSGAGTTYAFTNGLTNSTNTISLGGTLTQNTTIGTSSFGLSFLGLGNSQSLFIGASGYVGIGTTNPSKKLDVVGDIELSGTLFVGAGVTGSSGQVLASNGAGSLSWITPAGTTYTSGNGVTLNGSTIGLGGSLTQNTTIGTSSFGLSFVGLGGSQALFIGASGTIGIGTTNPGAKLDIQGNLYVSSTLNVNSIAGYSGSDIRFNNGPGFTTFSGNVGINNTTPSAKLHVVGTGSSHIAIFDGSGNVGIGTTNPSKKLDVVGDIELSGTLFVGAGVTGTNNQVLASNGAGGLQWITSGAGTTYAFTNGLTNSTNTISLGGTLTQNTTIGTSSFGLSFLGLGNSQSLFIGASGYVGIGTTNPSKKLDVAGDIKLTGTLFVGAGVTGSSGQVLSSNGAGSLSWITPSGASYSFTNGLTSIGGGNTLGLGGTLTQNTTIGTSSFGLSFLGLGNTQAFYIGSNGRVGIGSTSPSYKLEIAGSDNNYLGYIYNIGTSTSSGGLSIRSDGSGNLLNLNSSGSDIMTVSSVQTVINNPVSFTSSGNISSAYDLVFTNTTSSAIKSSASLNIQSGEIFNSSNLNLTTFNSGELVLDTPGGVVLNQAQNWTLGTGTTSTIALNIQSGLLNFDTTNSRIGIGTTAPSKKLDVVGDIKLTGTLFVGAGVTGASGQVLSSNGAGSLSWITPSGATYTAGNGITMTGTVIGLGGSLTQNTTIGTSSFGLSFLGLGNSQSLFIGASGYVGIGTTSPLELLQVGSLTTPANIGLVLSNTEGAIRWYNNAGTPVNSIRSLGTTEMAFTVNSLERMRISENGYVGIGNTDPAGPLQISIGNTNSFIVASNGNIGFGTTSPIGFFEVKVNGTGGTSAFNIAANGKVGIGNSSPAYQLDVAGSASGGIAFFKNRATGASNVTVVIQTSVGQGTTQASNAGEYIRFLNSNGVKTGRIRVGGTASVAFATSGANDLAEFVIGSEPTQSGDLITFNGDKFAKATPGSVLAGIHSSYATLIGRESLMDEPNAFPLAISGIVQLKVSSENGPIHPGDPLAGSSFTGIAAKAIKPGQIVARALNSYTDSNPNHVGTIEVIAGLNWFDPDVYLTETGQINVNHNISDSVLSSLGYNASKNEIESAQYNLADSLGHPITKISQFAQISSAKIKAGLISTTNLIAKNIIAETTKSKKIQTAVISPLSDISDTIVVEGNLEANKITADSATVNSLQAAEATISTLYADNIISKEGNFGTLMSDKITALREELRNTISTLTTSSLPAEASAAAGQSALVAESSNWNFNVGSSQTEITGSLSLTDNMQIGAKLTVLGDSQLGNAFVTGTFTAGEIAIKENYLETTASNLYIQPSGLGNVDIMNHTLIIAENGEVTVNGNFTASGKITSTSLFANLIEADEIKTKIISTEAINVATASATPIIAESGFAALATSSATLSSNASAGTVVLPAGKTELIINNSKINTSSIIYLTPAGSTGNQVVYLKSKFISPTPSTTPESTSSATTPSSSFTLAIDQSLPTDLTVNYWIIN